MKIIRGFFSYVSWPKALIKRYYQFKSSWTSSQSPGHNMVTEHTKVPKAMPFNAEGIPRSDHSASVQCAGEVG